MLRERFVSYFHFVKNTNNINLFIIPLKDDLNVVIWEIFHFFSMLQNGVTPLHVASHYDHQNVALLLLEKGASPHAMAKNGHSPLHIAARKNQVRSIKNVK